MHRICLALFASAIFGLSGCSDRGAEELFETAQIEELQNNPEHARKLYEQVLEGYPGTEFALKAEKRLSEMRE